MSFVEKTKTQSDGKAVRATYTISSAAAYYKQTL